MPESLTALEAISAIKYGKTRTALIIDEYGGVSGLVTLSDLMEAVVGDLPQSGEEEDPEIVQRGDGSWLVDGSMSVGEFIEELALGGIHTEGDYETVAGLVLALMGSIPRAGDICNWEGLTFEVMDMDGNRIDKLLVTKTTGDMQPRLRESP